MILREPGTKIRIPSSAHEEKMTSRAWLEMIMALYQPVIWVLSLLYIARDATKPFRVKMAKITKLGNVSPVLSGFPNLQEYQNDVRLRV